jgi:hypothetical protein
MKYALLLKVCTLYTSSVNTDTGTINLLNTHTGTRGVRSHAKNKRTHELGNQCVNVQECQ